MSEIVAKRPSKRRRAGKKLFTRPKPCRFCMDATIEIDYKDPKVLRTFLTERHKIIPRRVTGNCARHQRKLTTEIKRARLLALIPFTSAHQQ